MKSTLAKPESADAVAISGLYVAYGQTEVLKGLSLAIPSQGVTVLMGPNGCGKTTLLKAILGVIPVTSGTIHLGERDITRWSTNRRVGGGLVLVPQGRRLFNGMTVMENLELGGYTIRSRPDLLRNINYWLDFFPILRDKRKQLAGELSGGQQQMLAIARGLVSGARVALMDEPSLGVAPKMLGEIEGVVARLAAEAHIAFVIVEQNVQFALDLADRVALFSAGTIKGVVTPAELADGKVLSELYFGSAADALRVKRTGDDSKPDAPEETARS
jgi:branched-chain amino acid transport system ATP-binding protein